MKHNTCDPFAPGAQTIENAKTTWEYFGRLTRTIHSRAIKRIFLHAGNGDQTIPAIRIKRKAARKLAAQIEDKLTEHAIEINPDRHIDSYPSPKNFAALDPKTKALHLYPAAIPTLKTHLPIRTDSLQNHIDDIRALARTKIEIFLPIPIGGLEQYWLRIDNAECLEILDTIESHHRQRGEDALDAPPGEEQIIAEYDDDMHLVLAHKST